jgi:hypothetical protein
MGSYVLPAYIELENFQVDDIWLSTQIINAKIATLVGEGTMLINISDEKELQEIQSDFEIMSDLISDLEVSREFNEQLSKYKHCDLTISNIGSWVSQKVSLIENGRLKLSETYFCDTMNSTPSLLFGIGIYIGLFNKELQILLNMNKASINETYAKRFSEILFTNFENF